MQAFWVIGLLGILFCLMMAIVAPTAEQGWHWIVPAVLLSGFAIWQKIVK